MITNRNYKEGDEEAIIDLFERAYDKKLNLNAWKWRFMDNPAGESVIRLSFIGDKLLSQYALSPVDFLIDGVPVKGVMSLDSMTDPEYRGKGLFTRGAVLAYAKSIHLAYKFVYGFPNDQSYVPFVHRLRWKGFGKMSMMFLREESLTHTVRQVERFDERVYDLIGSVSKGRIMNARNVEFLNWRYVDNPKNDYSIFIIEEDDYILGYSVLKKYYDGEKIVGNVVDIAGIDSDYIDGLLRHASRYFSIQGISEVSMWYPHSIPPENSDIRPMDKTYFGFAIIDLPGITANLLHGRSRWYLTMGDSDVF